MDGIGHGDSRRSDPAAAKAAYRDFVRTHHPDVGGDPEVFAAGVRRLRARMEQGGHGDDRVVFVRRQRGFRRVLTAMTARRARRRRRRVI